MNSRVGSTRDNPFSNRKARDRAFTLLIVGLVLLVPPVAGIFQIDMHVAGIPFTALYLFIVWGLLIAGAGFLSNKLKEDSAVGGEPELPEGTDK